VWSVISGTAVVGPKVHQGLDLQPRVILFLQAPPPPKTSPAQNTNRHAAAQPSVAQHNKPAMLAVAVTEML
jgi:hypothetical protein